MIWEVFLLRKIKTDNRCVYIVTDAGEMPENKGMFFIENFAPHGELLAKPMIL